MNVLALATERKLQEIAARDLGGPPDDYDVANERFAVTSWPSGRLTAGSILVAMVGLATPRRRWVRLAWALVLAVVPLVVSGQSRVRRDAQWSAANPEYSGQFVFTRIRYGSSMGGWGFGGARWSHDYPRADLHLPQIIKDATAIDTHLGGSNVFDLDDPELFKYPMAYISEPGFWTMSEAEVRGLRNYFLKGGFVIFDDFEAEQWHNFEAQLRRALPEYRLIEVDVTYPIYHVFFDIKALDFPHPLVNVVPRYYAIFEENDPRRRMMAIVNYNNDVAEYWEWSDTGFLPVDFTNEAYKLGVNYIVYALTH